MGPQKNFSPRAGFEPRTFGTQGENATTPPRDSKLHEKKYYFAHWTRRFKFCPKCPYHTQNEHIVYAQVLKTSLGCIVVLKLQHNFENQNNQQRRKLFLILKVICTKVW